jgi:hypothetical protein
MSTPHGEYLGIVAPPDSALFFVVYPQLGQPTNQSVIPTIGDDLESDANELCPAAGSSA